MTEQQLTAALYACAKGNAASNPQTTTILFGLLAILILISAVVLTVKVIKETRA